MWRGWAGRAVRDGLPQSGPVLWWDDAPAAIDVEGGTASVQFEWVVPGVQGQALIDLAISAEGEGCSVHRDVLGTGVVNELTTAVIEAGQQQLQNCGTTTTQSCEDTPEDLVIGMVPFLGTANGVVETASDACLAVEYWNSGRHAQSAAMWLVTAVDVVGASLSLAGDIACVGTGVGCFVPVFDDVIPDLVSGGITCLTSLFDPPASKHDQSTLSPIEVASDTLMNWLPDSLQCAFTEAGDTLANLAVCSGSVRLRVEADSSFTTVDSLGHAGIVVLPVGAHPIQFAAIRPGAARPYHAGANITDAVTIRLVATAADTCRLVVFHRGYMGEVARLAYAPSALEPGGSATLATARDSTGFVVSVDRNGDGFVERLLFPGGIVVSVPLTGHASATGRTIALVRIGPNPFRANTSIYLRLAGVGSSIRLVIHDVAGRRVAEQNLGRLANGDHVINWDGRDAAGNRVPAGVYFVRAVCPDGASPSYRLVILR